MSESTHLCSNIVVVPNAFDSILMSKKKMFLFPVLSVCEVIYRAMSFIRTDCILATFIQRLPVVSPS